MRIVFNCNLDEAKPDVRRLNEMACMTALPIPRKGENIRFSFQKRTDQAIYSYDLAIVDVSYDYGRSVIIVELHLTTLHSKMSITQWTDWFKSHRYG